MKPIKAPKSPAKSLPEHVCRFDTRSPSEIKAEGGFKSWGENMNLYDHINGVSIRNKTSGFVATSRKELVSEVFSEGYVLDIYIIKTPSNAIDVNKFVGNSFEYGFDWEYEIVVPKIIPAKKIVSWNKIGGL